jgi:hypothetical protein
MTEKGRGEKWSVFFNSGNGWQEYSLELTKGQAELVLDEAVETSKRLMDGWQYELRLSEKAIGGVKRELTKPV